jgi:hypothetical protein
MRCPPPRSFVIDKRWPRGTMAAESATVAEAVQKVWALTGHGVDNVTNYFARYAFIRLMERDEVGSDKADV